MSDWERVRRWSSSEGYRLSAPSGKTGGYAAHMVRARFTTAPGDLSSWKAAAQLLPVGPLHRLDDVRRHDNALHDLPLVFQRHMNVPVGA